MAQAAGIQISCAQFEPRIGEIERNVETSLKLIGEAADSGSRLIVLPELCIRLRPGKP
jgi:N-carbamoylputrescine amidase